MTILQRVQHSIIGMVLIIAAVTLVLLPEESYALIPFLLGISMIVYGVYLLIYYLRLARHMVGGKAVMYQAVIIMDIALFTTSISALNNRFVILLYLLGIYAFSGVVDILRALEAKNAGSDWKLKFVNGIANMAFVIALIIIGFVVGRTDIFVYGYAFSIAYSGVMRIINTFKRTAIVYIQ